MKLNYSMFVIMNKRNLNTMLHQNILSSCSKTFNLILRWKSRICWDKHEISTLSGSNLALLEPLHYFSALKANLNHYGFGLMGPTFFPLEICQNDSRCLKTHLLPHVSPKPKNEILDYVLGKRIDFRKNISSTKVLRIEFWVIYISHI